MSHVKTSTHAALLCFRLHVRVAVSNLSITIADTNPHKHYPDFAALVPCTEAKGKVKLDLLATSFW